MPEMWLNGGIDICKKGLLEKLMKRQSPASNTEVHGPIKANKVVFNAANPERMSLTMPSERSTP